MSARAFSICQHRTAASMNYSRDSIRGMPDEAVAGLTGNGIDLLTAPVLLGPSSDVHISALRVPESGQLGRALPIEVTVASQSPCTIRVKVWRKKSGSEDNLVDLKTVE